MKVGKQKKKTFNCVYYFFDVVKVGRRKQKKKIEQLIHTFRLINILALHIKIIYKKNIQLSLFFLQFSLGLVLVYVLYQCRRNAVAPPCVSFVSQWEYCAKLKPTTTRILRKNRFNLKKNKNIFKSIITKPKEREKRNCAHSILNIANYTFALLENYAIFDLNTYCIYI